MLQVVAAGVELEDVGLFIDQNHSGLQKPAELKFGWGGESAQPCTSLILPFEHISAIVCNAVIWVKGKFRAQRLSLVSALRATVASL